MAKLLESEFKNNNVTWDSGVSFKRLNPQPIDIDSIFFDLDSALSYAQEGKNAYVGQQIIVINSGTEPTIDLYVIKNEAGDLATINSSIKISNDESSPISLNYEREGQDYKLSVGINETGIGTEFIGQKAITSDKIYEGAITTEKIADRAVGNQQLQSGAVLSDTIEEEAIQTKHLNKESFETLLDFNEAGQITENLIMNSAVTADKIADKTITNEKIADKTITNEKIADTGINSNKIVVEENLKLNEWIEKNKIIKLKFSVNNPTFINGHPSLLICNDQELIKALQNDIIDGNYQVLNCALAVDNNVITSDYLEALKKIMNLKVFPSYVSTNGGIGIDKYDVGSGLGCYFYFFSEDDNTSEMIQLQSPVILELLIQRR